MLPFITKEGRGHPINMASMEKWVSTGLYPIEHITENKLLNHTSLAGVMDPMSMVLHDLIHTVNTQALFKLKKLRHRQNKVFLCEKMRACFSFLKSSLDPSLGPYSLFFLLHETIVDKSDPNIFNVMRNEESIKLLPDFALDVVIKKFLQENEDETFLAIGKACLMPQRYLSFVEKNFLVFGVKDKAKRNGFIKICNEFMKNQIHSNRPLPPENNEKFVAWIIKLNEKLKHVMDRISYDLDGPIKLKIKSSLTCSDIFVTSQDDQLMCQ